MPSEGAAAGSNLQPVMNLCAKRSFPMASPSRRFPEWTNHMGPVELFVTEAGPSASGIPETKGPVDW